MNEKLEVLMRTRPLLPNTSPSSVNDS